MNKYSFRATMIKDDKRTGFKKGKTWNPKGFYYQKKNIVVVVGNIDYEDTIRISLPIELVKIELFLNE